MQALAQKKISSSRAESILEAIRARVPSAAFESWITPLKISTDENFLNIIAQNQFSADFINRTYKSMFESVADEFGLELSIGIARAVQTVARAENDNEIKDFHPIHNAPRAAHHNFDAFIISDENSFAVSAAKKLADGAVTFSPLFIYGASGCGKSLLVGCINSSGHGKTLFMTGAQFVSEFLRSISEKSVFAFKDFCRNCDTFIMDDVQALSGKRACMDEFQTLLVDLIKSNVNVVLTANAAPGSLTGFDRRMQSVFASGLTVDLAAPSQNVRRAMLMGAGVSINVADALAPRIAADGHLVNGIAKKIQTYSEIMNEKITIEIADKLLADVIVKNKTPLSMVRAMCEKLGVSQTAVCSSSRARAVVRARQIMMFALKSATKLSLSEIGMLVGDRDHATVLYGIAQVEKLRKTDLLADAEINQMLDECR